jgi:sugar-specific transcriptional regulator TrmB
MRRTLLREYLRALGLTAYDALPYWVILAVGVLSLLALLRVIGFC